MNIKEYKKNWNLNNYLNNKKEINKQTKEYHYKNKEQINKRRRNNKLKQIYGIGQIEYNEFLIKQNGLCAICLQPETNIKRGKIIPLSVDHDHKTGKIRGLLCNNCNSMLGYSKDLISTLDKAKEYLLINMKHMEKKKGEIWLNLGCGVSLADDFINVDNFFDLEDLKKGQKDKDGHFQNARVTKDTQFVRADICNLPFEDNYADYIECNDVIEHQPMNRVGVFLKEIYRVLKPGGKLGMSTTNFDELAKLWTINITGNKFETEDDWERYTKLSQIIYGNQAGEGEFHKVAFNPTVIAYFLQVAGFKAENLVISIFPTNTPYVCPQKAYRHFKLATKDLIVLSEMMWIEVTK